MFGILCALPRGVGWKCGARRIRVQWRIHRFPGGPQPDSPRSRFRKPPLRSRTVGFPQSGSDLGLLFRGLPPFEGSLNADSYPPRFNWVCPLNRFYATNRPSRSGFDRTAHSPESLCLSLALPPRVGCPASHQRALPPFFARMDSCASPHPSPCLWPHALVRRSLQVAVSPCWEGDYPDVISANLSPCALTPIPAALKVHLPVSSLQTSAFPTLGPGRR